MKAWLLLGLLPSLALAEPRIETIDRGTAVEIIAHDITAANTTIIPVRSRLEVAVTGKPAPIKAPSSDPTIVIAELDKSTLSVKTVLDRADVKLLAPHAKAMQIGPDLHIMIPRKVPAAGAAFELPEPTLGEVPNIVKVETVEPAKPAVAAPPPAPVVEPEPVEAKPAPAEPKPIITKPASSTNPLSRSGMLGVLALVALGCGVWILKRRKAPQGPTSSIEILAQHHLGAKAKVVWLAAGAREMVIAVTPQGVRMLGQWKRTEDAAAQQFATYTENGQRTRLPTAQIVEPTVERTNSPAVAGLLKLRANTVRPTDHVVDDEVATGDVEADAAWAKEILMATRASASRSIR